MKLMLFALMVVMTGSAFTDEKGPHGGRVQKVDNYTIEVKRDFSRFYVYLLDENNRTISSPDIRCEIRFNILDGSSVEMPLKPYKEEGFTLDFGDKKYNSFRVTFKLAGKDISAKFESENILVKEATPADPAFSERSAPR